SGSLARAGLGEVATRTPVRWVDLSEKAHDLILTLADEPANGALVAEWPAIPPPGQLDLALQRALARVYGFVVGVPDAMPHVCRWIQVLAHPMSQAIEARALVVGETGVGKELVVRAIHRLGPRRRAPMINVNCAALPKDLVQSALFGHARGA